MTYALLPHDIPESVVASFLAVLGGGPINAWLENELHYDQGLWLRDDVSPADVLELLRTWPQGRLFTSLADIRWEQESAGSLHLVIIADDVTEGIFKADDPVLREAGGQQHLLLWGERRDGKWAEGRIPNLARYYPAHWKGPYAAILAQSYEADWPEAATVRVVMRYFKYVDEYRPEFDPRFRRQERPQT
ncbi:MAG: hypothetical protein IPO81_00585 [Kouleothrix sp.]|nr:hypothetical protein [Kouleothrix sp.]